MGRYTMDLAHDEGSTAARRIYWFPLMAAAAAVVIVNVFNIYILIRNENPNNPWESGLIEEGWRITRGLPVYEDRDGGHSTLMYGPLGPYLIGAIFRATGPVNRAGRVVSLLASLAVVTTLAWVACPPRRAGGASAFLVSWSLLFGLNHIAVDYYAESRPDMTAILFGLVGLILMYRGRSQGRWRLVALGTAALLVGVLFKQTVAIFAVVPALAALPERGLGPRREVLFAATPLLGLAALLGAIRLLFPTVAFYMFTIPRSYPIIPRDLALKGRDFLDQSPLFLVLFVEWLTARDDGEPRRLSRWVVASLLVAIPASALTAAKTGGDRNSFLPAYFPMMTFCALRLARLARVAAAPGPTRRLFLGAALAAVVLLTFTPPIDRPPGLFVEESPRHGEYRAIVELAAVLPGKVVSPEDPTIALRAKGYAGRNLHLEYDGHPVPGAGWPPSMPASIRRDIQSADFLIRLPALPLDWLTDADLAGLGFVREPGRERGLRSYQIWKNERL